MDAFHVVRRPVDLDFRRLREVLLLEIMKQMALPAFTRAASVILPIEIPKVLDLPAYDELVLEVLDDFGVQLERDVGFPPMTPEYFVRLVFPTFRNATHTNNLPVRPALELVAGLDVEEMYRREMAKFSRCRLKRKMPR